MTFEEWKEKHNDLIENVAITFFNYGCGVDTKTCYDELEYLLKKAFNAGKTKWHKVADGDLPKENNLYLVAIKDNGLAIAYFNGLHWETKFNLGDFGNCLETVIAWCEIPKFEEK